MSAMELFALVALALGLLAFAYFLIRLFVEHSHGRRIESFEREVALVNKLVASYEEDVTRECNEMSKRIDSLKELLRGEREQGDKILAESAAKPIADHEARLSKLEMEVYR